GIVRIPWVAGRPLERHKDGAALAVPMARYCALRANLFPAQPAADLTEMARVNVAIAAGVELPASFRLECERPAIMDGRMLRHEWIRTPRGELLKVDAVAHGDDHFYPGPADVAWDLAGAAIEL